MSDAVDIENVVSIESSTYEYIILQHSYPKSSLIISICSCRSYIVLICGWNQSGLVSGAHDFPHIQVR